MGQDNPHWTQEAPSSAEARATKGEMKCFGTYGVTLAPGETFNTVDNNIRTNLTSQDDPIFMYLFTAAMQDGYTPDVHFRWIISKSDSFDTKYKVEGNLAQHPITPDIPLRIPYKGGLIPEVRNFSDQEVTVNLWGAGRLS